MPVIKRAIRKVFGYPIADIVEESSKGESEEESFDEDKANENLERDAYKYKLQYDLH